MARTSRPASEAATRSAASDGGVTAAPLAAGDDTAAFGMDFTRSIVNLSLSASQGLLRFLDQLQQMNAQTLKELAAGLDEAVGEARRARDVQELLAIHADLASSQMARAAQHCGSLITRWLDAEARFVEQAQEEAGQLSQQLLGNGVAVAQPAPGRPAAESPLALLGGAQNALTEMTRQWVEAVKSAANRTSAPLH